MFQGPVSASMFASGGICVCDGRIKSIITSVIVVVIMIRMIDIISVRYMDPIYLYTKGNAGLCVSRQPFASDRSARAFVRHAQLASSSFRVSMVMPWEAGGRTKVLSMVCAQIAM